MAREIGRPFGHPARRDFRLRIAQARQDAAAMPVVECAFVGQAKAPCAALGQANAQTRFKS
ncbi:MAG: hypothetical protein WBW93_18005 [Steroidobacteraceae bacterium]